MIDRLPRQGYASIRAAATQSGRLLRGAGALRRVLIGFAVVFLISLGHDEIAAELHARGLTGPVPAELAEVAIGLVLFVAWGMLSVRLVRLVDTARGHARAGDGQP